MARGDSLLSPVDAPLRALAQAFVPELEGGGEAEWHELTRVVESALERQPSATRRQIVLLVRFLDWMPIARHGRRLRSLEPGVRTRFLERLQNSGVLLLRRGVWGLRTLIFMGYYTRADAYADIGYAARADGWEALE